MKLIENQFNIPDEFIDFIRQDILIDPVITSDGVVYSKESILHWFGVCETQKISYLSPLKNIEITTNIIENKILKLYLNKLKYKLDKFKRISMTGSIITNNDNNNNNNKNDILLQFQNNDIIYCIHWLARVFIPIQRLSLSIRDIIPKWEAPQFVVIGEIGCGKSTFLERLSMMSLFPRGENFHTCLPIHLKLRHSTNYSPPIIRVIDTKRKVNFFKPLFFVKLLILLFFLF